MDYLLPLFVLEQGGLVVFVPDAVATDRPITGLREQFRDRARTATRGIEANLSMAGRLAPWRHPRAALAVWSHKVLRWASPWLVLAAAGSGAALAATGRSGYAIAPAAVAAGGVAAVVAHAISRTGRKPTGRVLSRIRRRQPGVRARLAERRPRSADRGLARRGVA